LTPDPGSILDFSSSTAQERWKLTASATRDVLDPFSASSADGRLVRRFEGRDAFGGDASRANLAFDWQRLMPGSRLSASAFALRRGVDLRPDAEDSSGGGPGARFDQRERRSLVGAAARWNAAAPIGGMFAIHSASVHFRSETLDAEGRLTDAGNAPPETVREDRLRQASFGFGVENELRIASSLRSVASVRVDRYRFGVDSDAVSHAGSSTGTLISSYLSLVANPTRNMELFISGGRGPRASDTRVPGVAFDARNGAPLGYLDPFASLRAVEAGVRTGLLGMDTTLTGWRAQSDAELTLLGDGGVEVVTRPTVRTGLQATARFHPFSALTLDFDATVLRARYADGAAERIPGAAERFASAGATLTPSRGWKASLFVTYFGSRPAVNDDRAHQRSSSFVNARLTRDLSKKTRVSVDVFNIFDKRVGDVDYFSATRLWSQPGAADNFLFHPAESRGFRVRLRTTF
jgi:hypothetical protein